MGHAADRRDRNDHLNWMHEHFADETLVAGQESELDLGPGQPSGEAYPATPGCRCGTQSQYLTETAERSRRSKRR